MNARRVAPMTRVGWSSSLYPYRVLGLHANYATYGRSGYRAVRIQRDDAPNHNPSAGVHNPEFYVHELTLEPWYLRRPRYQKMIESREAGRHPHFRVIEVQGR